MTTIEGQVHIFSRMKVHLYIFIVLSILSSFYVAMEFFSLCYLYILQKNMFQRGGSIQTKTQEESLFHAESLLSLGVFININEKDRRQKHGSGKYEGYPGQSGPEGRGTPGFPE